MHVDSRKIAMGGITMALAVLCIVLSGILEFNTLFLLAAASFLTGINIREGGLAAGTAFYAGTVALGFLLAPNKWYCVTFAAMGFYIVCDEGLFLAAGRPGEEKLCYGQEKFSYSMPFICRRFFAFPGCCLRKAFRDSGSGELWRRDRFCF